MLLRSYFPCRISKSPNKMASTETENSRGLLSRCHLGCRRLAIAALCLGVIVLVGLLFAKQVVHEQIRSRVEAMLAEHYFQQDLAVTVGSARLLEGQGIEIRDVSIGKLRVGSGAEELVRVDRIFLASDIKLKDLLTGPPPATRIEIRGLKVVCSCNESGEWDIQRVFKLPKFGKNAPVPVSIWNAEIRCLRNGGTQRRPLVLREIDLELAPTPAPTSSGKDNNSQHVRYQVAGSASSDHFKQVRVKGWIDNDDGKYSIEGQVDGLRLSQDLHESLPLEPPTQIEGLKSVSGRASFTFHVGHAAGPEGPIQFDVRGKLTEGRIEDPRLPYPLTDLVADIQFSNEKLRVENVTARIGLGTVELTCEKSGFGANAPLVLHAKANRLELDSRLAESLPESMRRVWDAYSPSGTVNVDLELVSDQNGWRPDLMVECLDVSFAHHKFPYRIDDCIGTVHWTSDLCVVDLRALVASRVLSIAGRFENPGPNYTGGADIRLSGPIPVDEKLLSALREDHEQFVRSFHPRGWITAEIAMRRDSLASKKPTLTMAINLKDCSIRYDKFPYPLERVSGTLKLANHQWQILNVVGYNDGAEVVCSGNWRRSPQGDNRLDLHFVGQDIALEEDELRLALKPAARKVWSDLRPRGSVDQVVADLTYDSKSRHTSLDVRAEKWVRRNRSEGRSVSINPVWLPYQMDDVTGTVRYRNGALTLDKVSARHGDTTIHVGGSGRFDSTGWQMNLNELAVQRLNLDHELLAALPPSLSGGLEKLNLSGHLTVEGNVGLSAGIEPRRPLRANWKVYIDVVNGSLDCGVRAGNIHGGVRLTGESDHNGLRSRGELEIDSLIYKDVQLTEVRGPIWIDKTRVSFGRWAQPPSVATPPRRITAKIFGGALECDAQVVFGKSAPFQLQVNLTQANLTQFAKEKAPRMRNFSGTAFAEVRMHGTSQGTHTFRGNGWVRLRNAKIYEVPVLLAMLKLLRVRQPDTVAFDSSDMDFRIHGDHIYFDRMNFSGDAISLRGNGWMNLAGQIDLSFATILGRNDVFLPIVSDALGLASRQFLLIEVDGTLEQPNQPTTKVLPALNDSLRQLFPELKQIESRSRPVLPRTSGARRGNNS